MSIRYVSALSHLRLAPVVAVVAVALVLAPSAARAANELENPSVTPRTGTTSTVFVFSVQYTSRPPGLLAREVWAEAGGVRVELAPDPLTGTYSGESRLPAGTWDVTFHATELQGSQPSSISGGRVVVGEAAPPPTAPPTAAPTPVPAPVPTATPLPATPVPTPVPTPALVITPMPSESATLGTPGGAIFSASPTAEPTATSSAAAAGSSLARSDGVDVGQVTLLFIGGTLAGSGAAFAGVQLVQRRPWRRMRGLTPSSH